MRRQRRLQGEGLDSAKMVTHTKSVQVESSLHVGVSCESVPLSPSCPREENGGKQFVSPHHKNANGSRSPLRPTCKVDDCSYPERATQCCRLSQPRATGGGIYLSRKSLVFKRVFLGPLSRDLSVWRSVNRGFLALKGIYIPIP